MRKAEIFHKNCVRRTIDFDFEAMACFTYLILFKFTQAAMKIKFKNKININ